MPKLLYLTTILLACTVGVNGQVYDFQGFSLEEGLPKSGVYDLTQDHDGWLWVGTEGGGVCRFDGIAFECFGKEEGLAGDIVRCLYEDSQDQLWIGTEDGGISVRHQGKFHNLTTEDGLPSNHIRTITEDEEGHIWVGTLGGGLAHLESDNISLHNEENGLPHNKIRSSVIDSLGNPWFCTDGGIVHWNGSNIEIYTTEEGVPHNKVLVGFKDSESNLWFGCENGVVRWEDGAFHSPNIPGMAEMRIKAIAQDDAGLMWFGTREGILVGNPSDSTWNTTRYNQSNGLSNNRIRSIYKDRTNAMWIGTYFGGINRFNGESFVKYSAKSGFPENNVTSIFEDGSGDIWLGTFDGSVYKYANGIVQKVHSNASMEDNTVMCFGSISSGQVYFGTLNQGVFEIKNGKVSPLCLEGKDVLDISTLANGMLFATSDGVYRWTDHVLRSVMMQDTICHVSQLVGDSLLLIGTEIGLFRSELPLNGTSELIGGTEGVEITSISKDAVGYYWIGTMGHGLLRCNLKKVRKYRNSSYLSSYDINFVQTDQADNLWIGTTRGLDRLELDPTQSFVLYNKTFTVENGYTGGETNRSASMIDRHGHLWIGTVRGVASHKMGPGYAHETAPLLSVEMVTIFDKEIDWSEITDDVDPHNNIPLSFSLAPDQNSLTFRVNGRDIRQPNDVRYQYMLEGYNFKWSASKETGVITYNNISPGDYTFLARSQNAAGFWNEQPLKIPFSIAAPLYERAWFIAICLAIATILFYLISSMRVRILKTETQRLEKKVRERTKELEQSKKKSDDLLLNILPYDTAEELKKQGFAKTRQYSMVSVLFSDFTGFTSLSEIYDSEELVAALDQCFRKFDRLTDRYNVEKIKTIGDAYMCATGLPSEDPNHAINMASFAFEMQEIMKRLNEENRKNSLPEWHIRVGIHSGPVIAGVVGEKKFAYDIWGDTVNIASRMESSGEADRVNISQSTYQLIEGNFKCHYRGEIEAKNKGKLKMYFIDEHLSFKNESVYEKGG